MTILASYLRHWTVFSSDHLSLDGENRHKYSSLGRFKEQFFEEGYWKDFLNEKVFSKKQVKTGI
jgi:hypothetical protein